MERTREYSPVIDRVVQCTEPYVVSDESCLSIASVSSQYKNIRLLVLSDAVPERNGVGSYYFDLVAHLSQSLDGAELIHPKHSEYGGYRYLTTSLPGDKTQQVSVPRPVKLWKKVKAFNPTMIVVPTPGPFGLAGVFIARKLNIPIVVGFHTHYEALAKLYWNSVWGQYSQKCLNLCNKMMFDRSAIVLANSPEMQLQARLCGANSADLMGTPLPQEYIHKPVKPLRDKIENVLFAGRLANEKNLPAIINCARLHPNLNFTIAGDGPLRELVESAANELRNVAMPGWLSRNQLLETIDNHDVLLLPSKVESFGTAAYEGMARGKLVIVSEDCGIVEWPKLREALFTVGAQETPSDTLTRLLTLPSDNLHHCSMMARQRSIEMNNWNTHFWLRSFETAIERHEKSQAGIAA